MRSFFLPKTFIQDMLVETMRLSRSTERENYFVEESSGPVAYIVSSEMPALCPLSCVNWRVYDAIKHYRSCLCQSLLVSPISLHTINNTWHKALPWLNL